MATVEITAPTTPHAIFAVLADGWSYASWVVGAAHIRDVDPRWTAVGARIHHTVGPWPVSIRDTTSVVAVEPDRLLELDARAWPLGRARIRIELEPTPRGHTRIRMTETMTAGPSKLLPEAITAPVLNARNRESLRRLVDIALGRHGGDATPRGEDNARGAAGSGTDTGDQSG